MSLNIHTIPAFDDNYLWLLEDTQTQQACVVDPGDAQPILQALNRLKLDLIAILITHKHPDHTGGIGDLLDDYPKAVVYGPKNEPIAHLTHPLDQRDNIHLLNTDFQILDVPGHTEGHIAYYDGTHLFCGDTLFAGGCGRVFSGTHEQLHHSLMSIAQLPPSTNIYCAHEYTLDNLGFAQWVEPDNPKLLQRIKDDQETRAANQPTVPSNLQLELDTNPFLRTHLPQVIAAANRYSNKTLTQGTDVFHAIRTWKDREYD